MGLIQKVRKTSQSVWTNFRTRHWRRPAYTSSASPIIIGGCGRSGTTLMRVIMDTHPHLCCGPESRLFLPHLPSTTEGRFTPAKLADRFDLPEPVVAEALASSQSQAEFIDRFFAAYCQSRGKVRWAEKTPLNVVYLDYIFEHFPKTRFIHMIRDGRDTVCSLRTHPRHKVVNGELVKLNTWHPIGPCVNRWVNDVRAGLAHRKDPRYTEVRYEELVARPRETLVRLFEFIGEPFDEKVLDYHRVEGSSRDATHFPQNPEATTAMYTKAVGRWHRDLTADELALVKRRAGPLLIELGYATDDRW